MLLTMNGAHNTACNKIAFFYQNLDQRDSAIFYAKKGFEVSKTFHRMKTLMTPLTCCQLVRTHDT